MPHARLPISSAWNATVANSGRSPWTLSPAAYAITLPSASSVATIAATVTTRGRSPSSSGTRAARAAAFFASVRSLRDITVTPPCPCLRLRGGCGSADMCFLGPMQCRGGRARIVGISDRAHHDDACGARLGDGTHVASVDAADGEPRLGGAELRRVTHELEPNRGATGLGRRRVDGTHREVVGARRDRRVHLLARMGGDADDPLVPHDRTRLVERHVVLPHVHAVRGALDGKV